MAVLLPPKATLVLGGVGSCLILVGGNFHMPILNELGKIALTAAVVGFWVYLIVLLLYEPGVPRQPDLGLMTYLRAFFSDWLTIMCGPASVPFTALAIWSTQRTTKVIWFGFAIACGIFGSYRVWRKGRLEAYNKLPRE
jgi:hypothetical protein